MSKKDCRRKSARGRSVSRKSCVRERQKLKRQPKYNAKRQSHLKRNKKLKNSVKRMRPPKNSVKKMR